MRLLGFDLRSPVVRAASSLSAMPPQAIGDRGNWWWPVARESFTGAWQRNVEIRAETVMAFTAVHSCVSLISADIAKLRPMLVEQDQDGVWTETKSSAFSPVLRRPNRYQNRINFIKQWIASKLIHGNTYVLKERDDRKVVTRLYILDPQRVRVLVAPDGGVYYEVRADWLAGITDEVLTIPASEIIHDLMLPLYHPLVGISPIYACGLAATQGLRIQNHSLDFFSRRANPSGILTTTEEIDEDTVRRIQQHWQENYTGVNVGNVAVMGSGLKFEPMSLTAVDAQLIEQLKMTSEVVCSNFHVPGYMVNVASPPTHQPNVEALQNQYYTQCLQELIESWELCMKEGLGLTDNFDVRLDLDSLLRMDTATQYQTIAEGIKGGFLAPNEGRLKINLKPVEGGDSPMVQQQNYSLEALAKRDAKADPFKTQPAQPAADPTPATTEDDSEPDPAVTNVLIAWELRSALEKLPPIQFAA